jgi:hypothetical protein
MNTWEDFYQISWVICVGIICGLVLGGLILMAVIS